VIDIEQFASGPLTSENARLVTSIHMLSNIAQYRTAEEINLYKNVTTNVAQHTMNFIH